jgi:hypothetical protein
MAQLPLLDTRCPLLTNAEVGTVPARVAPRRASSYSATLAKTAAIWASRAPLSVPAWSAAERGSPNRAGSASRRPVSVNVP